MVMDSDIESDHPPPTTTRIHLVSCTAETESVPISTPKSAPIPALARWIGRTWRLNTSPEFTLGLKLLQEAPAPVHSWLESASLQGGVLYSHR